MTTQDVLDLITVAGDHFPRDESRSFWRDLCESIAHAIDEGDATMARDELASLLDRYTSDVT